MAGAWLLATNLVAAPVKELSISTRLAESFLTGVCSQAPGKAFADAWLAHEERNWAFYEAAYYRTAELKKARVSLAHEMAERRDEMCKHTRAFTMIAPSVLRTLAPKVTALTGFEPALPLHFATPLQWTDGSGAEIGGQRVYIFNARHDTYARTTGMVATMIHELIHSAYYGRQVDEDKATRGISPYSSLQAALYGEGVAVYGTQLLLPEVGIGAVGLKPEDRDLAAKVQGTAAKELLASWGSRIDEGLHAKFFSGGWRGDKYPPKMGYYLGYQIFKKLEAEMGAEKAVRIGRKEFMPKAKAILEAIASRKS